MFRDIPPDGEFVIYLRKSRADIEKEARGAMETLGKHERRLTAFARERGYLVAEIRRELVSGESIQDRDVFRELMAEVGERRWAGIIVHEVDRLGRGDMMEAGWILSTLQFSATLVVTPEKTYDPLDRNDLQLLQDKMIRSNNELSNTKYRFRDGKEQSSRDGQHIATVAPFGYRKVVREDGMKTLEPTEWAPTVVEIYEEVAAGTPLSTLSMRLIARQVPGKWCNKRIKSLIENPVYKGVIAWNRVVKTVESRQGLDYVRKRVKNEHPIVVEGLHEAIVSDELWDEANAMIGKNTKKRAGTSGKNPLAGVLRCAKCGRAMRLARTGRNGCYGYYKHYKYSECSCAASRYDDVTQAVVAALGEALADIEVEVRGQESRRERLLREAEDLRRSIEAGARKIDKLMILFEDGAIDIDEFRRRRKSIDALASQARDRLEAMERVPAKDPVSTMRSIKALMATLADESLDAETRNIALKKIVERIDYAKEAGGTLQLTVTLR